MTKRNLSTHGIDTHWNNRRFCECICSAPRERRQEVGQRSHRGTEGYHNERCSMPGGRRGPTSSRHHVESNALAVILGESWGRSQSRCVYINKAILNQYWFCFNCPGCRATGTILAINDTQERRARIERALEETAKERRILQRTVTRSQAEKEALVDASHPTSRQREIHGRMRSVRFDAEPGGDRAYGRAKPLGNERDTHNHGFRRHRTTVFVDFIFNYPHSWSSGRTHFSTSYPCVFLWGGEKRGVKQVQATLSCVCCVGRETS